MRELGIHFITFSIFAFAFSSLMGNYYYAESNILFIKNNKVLLFSSVSVVWWRFSLDARRIFP